MRTGGGGVANKVKTDEMAHNEDWWANRVYADEIGQNEVWGK